MFRRGSQQEPEEQPQEEPKPQLERISSVLGDGTRYNGKLTGRGGVRIEGIFEGEVALNGLLVVGTTGLITCEDLRARTIIVAGRVKGDITAEKVEIRATGRVWGDVTTTAFSTEEGAFLRGQIQMEDSLELDLPVVEEIIVTEEKEETGDA